MPKRPKRSDPPSLPVAGHDLANVVIGMIVSRWRLEEPGHPHHGHLFVVSAIGPTGNLFLMNTTEPGEHYTEVSSLEGFVRSEVRSVEQLLDAAARADRTNRHGD